MVIVYRKNIEGLIENTEKNLKNDNINVNIKLNKIQKAILEMILKQPNITQNKIAEKMNMTNITVNRNINRA